VGGDPVDLADALGLYWGEGLVHKTEHAAGVAWRTVDPTSTSNFFYRTAYSGGTGASILAWNPLLPAARDFVNAAGACSFSAGLRDAALGLGWTALSVVDPEAGEAELVAEDGLRLYRFGGAKTADELSVEAERAAENGFPYGVSTSSRLGSRIKRTGNYGSAAASDIRAAGLGVEKTGSNPFHYTVPFPGKVDDEFAKTFNQLFFGE
jgi:hypothetical protein